MYEYINHPMTFFHGFWMLIFWAIFIYIILSLANKTNKEDKKTALEILKERLAKGEVSIEEFEKLKDTLSK